MPRTPGGSPRGWASSTWWSAHAVAATQATLTRRAGNAVLNRLASYLTGRPIPDLTSGFRGIRRDVLREFLHLLPNGFSTPTTTTLACIKAGYNVAFEPIDAGTRVGHSKMRVARDGARFLLILLKVDHHLQSAANLRAAQRSSPSPAGAVYGVVNFADRRTDPEWRGGAAAVCRDRVPRRPGLGTDCRAALPGNGKVESAVVQAIHLRLLPLLQRRQDDR